jgi:hypothetical protein
VAPDYSCLQHILMLTLSYCVFIVNDFNTIQNLIFVVHYSYVYWGEYPLAFAACLGQEECYRLMLARGANPDNQDTNGNTVLHMLVIYERLVSS